MRLEDERPVLACWQLLCWGSDWPLVATDAPPRPTWLERRFGDPAPWRLRAGAPATTDGSALYVPRVLALSREAGAGQEAELLRLLVLSLAAKLARDALRFAPKDWPARDLFWMAEGALGDARLACELPGLEPGLECWRQRALALRPGSDRLSDAERIVESEVQGLLATPLGEVEARLGPGLEPADLAAWARARAPGSAARYRGTAPVLHWGGPWRHGPSPRASGGPRRGEPPPQGRSRSLPRWLPPRRADPEEIDERTGPFVIPFADPHGAVQDARGLARLDDQAEDLDLDVLAEELAAQPEILRLRSDRAAHEVLATEDDGVPGDASGSPSEVGNFPGPEAAPGATIFVYPEWDHRIQRYRAAYCCVHDRPATAGDPDFAEQVRREHRILLERIRRELGRFRPRRQRLPRQQEGDSLDLDAWVEAWAGRVAGGAVDDRLYLDERPIRRDVVVSLLLDASASTDSTVSGVRRVVDLEKEAVFCLAEALETLGDHFALQTFSSQGPRRVQVETIKRIGERWDGLAQRRLAGVEPEGYTRLGGALRHATAGLAGESARHRLLLLVSDGRPDDEDEYEGAYGLEDVRRAVEEARLQRVRVFCLNVDRRGAPWLGRLFGPGGSAVLPRLEDLPERLTRLYQTLTRRL